MSKPRAVLSAAIVLLAAACTSGSGPGTTQGAGQSTVAGGGGVGGAASLSDPCSLLTVAEISAVVGQTVGPGSNADDPKSCDWQYPADGVPNLQVSIGIEDSDLATMCGTTSNNLGLTVTPVSGVGDPGACFSELAGFAAGTNLTFATNGHTFSVGATLGHSATSSQLLEADKALALDALARL